MTSFHTHLPIIQKFITFLFIMFNNPCKLAPQLEYKFIKDKHYASNLSQYNIAKYLKNSGHSNR